MIGRFPVCRMFGGVGAGMQAGAHLLLRGGGLVAEHPAARAAGAAQLGERPPAELALGQLGEDLAVHPFLERIDPAKLELARGRTVDLEAQAERIATGTAILGCGGCSRLADRK